MAKDSVKLVVFTLENNEIVYEYGIPIEQVHEITRQGKTLAMPGMPDFVEGIMNLRDHVIPFIDLKKRFGLSSNYILGIGKVDDRLIIALDMNKILTEKEKKCSVTTKKEDRLQYWKVAPLFSFSKFNLNGPSTQKPPLPNTSV